MPSFEDPFAGLKSDRKLTKEELARAIRFSIAAEYEAIQLYDQLAESIDDEYAIEVLRHVSDEEKVHVGEFLNLLKKIAPEEESFYEEGEKEAEELKFSSNFEALQYLSDYTQKRIKIANIPFDLSIADKERLVGVIGIEFRKGEAINLDYTLDKDGWFRRESGVGKGYGLMIRNLKITSSKPQIRGKFKIHKGKMTYLPSSEDIDDPSKYKTDPVYIWVYKNYEIGNVLSYIDREKGKWIP